MHTTPNDPWAAALAGHPTPWQATTIAEDFTTLGISDTTERRTIASRILGRLVTSFTDINGEEAQRIVQALDKRMSDLRIGRYTPMTQAERALADRMNSRFD
jgi:hypothetical protein